MWWDGVLGSGWGGVGFRREGECGGERSGWKGFKMREGVRGVVLVWACHPPPPCIDCLGGCLSHGGGSRVSVYKRVCESTSLQWLPAMLSQYNKISWCSGGGGGDGGQQREGRAVGGGAGLGRGRGSRRREVDDPPVYTSAGSDHFLGKLRWCV
ncbi:hypothetical protein Pcinc_029300 [Petrolisthes cinctipes]|uniref:Uncharacterized protein n=1 Tax=Petrolisthes cinctipes TaxID=88211 RepID=A0AAE1F0N6_PETCI|nr:hypothetical protein Pcinc_029300 [Petrolisthes cinctipes]